MFKQFKIWSVLALILFACNENEQEVAPLSAKETELLSVISEEGTAMFDASFTDLNELFSSSSVTELESFDADEFSRNSVLDHAKQSDFLSPHYELIEAVVDSENFSHTARSSSENLFTKEEQQYVDALTEAFSLLPDRVAFEEEIDRIESEIMSTISDTENRFKLLAIATSSVASVNYLFDNEEVIYSQFQEYGERLSEEYTSGHANGRIACDPPNSPNSPECQDGGGGGGSSCCFNGNFSNHWNWNDFGEDVVKGATAGGFAGAAIGGTASLGTLAVPSWIAGATAGGLGAGIAYGGAAIFRWTFDYPPVNTK